MLSPLVSISESQSTSAHRALLQPQKKNGNTMQYAVYHALHRRDWVYVPGPLLMAALFGPHSPGRALQTALCGDSLCGGSQRRTPAAWLIEKDGVVEPCLCKAASQAAKPVKRPDQTSLVLCKPTRNLFNYAKILKLWIVIQSFQILLCI